MWTPYITYVTQTSIKCKTQRNYTRNLYFIFSANKTPKTYKNKAKSSKRMYQWIQRRVIFMPCKSNNWWHLKRSVHWILNVCLKIWLFSDIESVYDCVRRDDVTLCVLYAFQRNRTTWERANKWENHKNIEHFCCCCGGFNSKWFGFDFVISAKKKLCSRPLHLHSISDNFFYFCGLEFGVDYRIFEVWNVSFQCTSPQLLFQFLYLRQRTLLNLHYVWNWGINGNGYEEMGKHTNLILKLILRSSE